MGKRTVSVQNISLYEGKLSGFEHPQYRIDIDGIYLGDYIRELNGIG